MRTATQSGSGATQHSSLGVDDPNGAAEVTAVVVGHNSARHFAELGHALKSGTVVPTRMLVVDNASVDDTAVQARLAGFEVYQAGSNDGFGAGCNAGLRATSTEFVLFCNPDVRPTPSALERLLAALTNTPMAAVAGAAVDQPLRARQFSRVTGNFWSFLPGWLQRRVPYFEGNLALDPSKDEILVDFATGAFILCRVAALRVVGGFDEMFFLYSEEEDLSRRLGTRGWQTLLVPSAIVLHTHGTSSEGVGKPVMAPFRFHSLYLYYRRYNSRLYAEFARLALSVCVLLDCAYRALTRQPQVYGPKTAMAPFRSIGAIRRDYERRLG
jgi:N-acetylglucosaminyl-diphospho-decaprenol L-rhamnosyltransferase